jgi:hypothetical protein
VHSRSTLACLALAPPEPHARGFTRFSLPIG